MAGQQPRSGSDDIWNSNAQPWERDLSSRIYLRHRWSHRGVLHRAAVRLANRLLWQVPFSVKYSIGMLRSRGAFPYCLLQEGDVAVQVGAPHDTLRAGRSRAVYLGLCVGRAGRVVVIEPDPQSTAALRSLAQKRDLPQLEVVACGAWSSQGQLKLYVDPDHPATNFTESTADYSRDDLGRFRAETVEVDTVDNILGRLNIARVKLVSITTNGAEREIIAGMAGTLDRGVPYLALARTDPGHESFVASLGYERLAFDDRGYTFGKSRSAHPEKE